MILTFQCALSADDLRRRHQGGAGDHRTRQCGYAGEHLRSYPAVLPCGAWQEVWKRLLCQARHPQPAGEPTISMTALLELLKDADPEMKAKLRLALLTWCKKGHWSQCNTAPYIIGHGKHPPCKNRAETVHPWLTKQKSHEIFRFHSFHGRHSYTLEPAG